MFVAVNSIPQFLQVFFMADILFGSDEIKPALRADGHFKTSVELVSAFGADDPYFVVHFVYCCSVFALASCAVGMSSSRVVGEYLLVAYC